MKQTMPEEAQLAWARQEGPVVLATEDGSGIPNAIYVRSIRLFDPATFVVADNYFHKTRGNILRNGGGNHGSLLFITTEGTSYQVKGKLEYHADGPFFEFMKQWNPARHPGHAAVALKVEKVFRGAELLG